MWKKLTTRLKTLDGRSGFWASATRGKSATNAGYGGEAPACKKNFTRRISYFAARHRSNHSFSSFRANQPRGLHFDDIIKLPRRISARWYGHGGSLLVDRAQLAM
jgi:hypothetical protein